jgi:superoxide dismutase, Fe-Mn family|tara:strand:+ start:1241 stop:1930 length:690 start_codon:yes stop_codon:yes gene_type:complete
MNSKKLKNEVLKAIDDVLPGKKNLLEAYIVEPKKFKLNTEKLSPKVKNARLNHFEKTVETLNKISIELEGADPENANKVGSSFRNQKVAEAFAINDAFLQGKFLDNISDLSSTITMDMLCFMRLTRDFGTFDTWQKDFIGCAKSSRDGYAVTAYSLYLKRYINFVVDSADTGVPFSAIPVIVLDVSEGVYYRDYVSNIDSYIKNMMREFDWNVIEARFKNCDKIARVSE